MLRRRSVEERSVALLLAPIVLPRRGPLSALMIPEGQMSDGRRKHQVLAGVDQVRVSGTQLTTVVVNKAGPVAPDFGGGDIRLGLPGQACQVPLSDLPEIVTWLDNVVGSVVGRLACSRRR